MRGGGQIHFRGCALFAAARRLGAAATAAAATLAHLRAHWGVPAADMGAVLEPDAVHRDSALLGVVV